MRSYQQLLEEHDALMADVKGLHDVVRELMGLSRDNLEFCRITTATLAQLTGTSPSEAKPALVLLKSDAPQEEV